jgi:hypothetical protein
LIADIFAFKVILVVCVNTIASRSQYHLGDRNQKQPASPAAAAAVYVPSIPNRAWVFNKEVTFFEIDYMDL